MPSIKFIARRAAAAASTSSMRPVSLLRRHHRQQQQQQQHQRRCISAWFAADGNRGGIGEHLRPATASSSSSSPSSGAPASAVVSVRTVHVEHHRSDDDDNEDGGAAAADAQRQPSSRNRSRRTRAKRPRRPSLDDRKVPSYKEFVHRFTVLSLYRGFLKCIRDTMPHNQEDLREQVRKEFKANKDDVHSFTVKQNIAEGQRRFEELKEFTGQSNKYTGESWINIKDPDDPRGRVGTGWPWAK